MNAGLETWLSQEGHLLSMGTTTGVQTPNTHLQSMQGCMGLQLQHCGDRWTLSAHCQPGQNSRVLVKGDTVSRQSDT